MSNTEFWQHIDTIIARGYDAQGLKLLEEYAELFISGRLVYKRFSPLEQHGCAAGGSNHVIASLLAGAGIDPSSLSAPEGSFQRERECAETQATRPISRKHALKYLALDEQVKVLSKSL